MTQSIKTVKTKYFAFLYVFVLLLIFSAQPVLSSSFKNLHLIPKGIMEDIKDLEFLVNGKELEHINIVALRGEYESFTFSVYSKSHCNLFSVTLTSLNRTDGKSQEISPEHIEIHRLKRGKTRNNVKDWMLVPIEESGIEKGKSVRIWITIHIPETTLPGIYKGTLVITPIKAEPINVPIMLKVLPQKLEDVPDVQFAVLYTVSPFGQYYKPEKYAQFEQEVLSFYEDLRAHGMTSISPKCSDWPYRRGNIEGLKAEVRLASRAGLKGPVLWYMSALINGAKGGKKYSSYDGKCDNWNEARDIANLREIVTITKKIERKKGWPEIIFITVDEPGTNTENPQINKLRMEILKKSVKVVSELGGRAATTVTELVDERHNMVPFSSTTNELRRFWGRVRPYCGIRIYGYGYPQGETNLYKEKEDALNRGHEVWFYNNKATMGTNRYLARTFFGVWGWKVGANGLSSWTYPGGRTVQWEIVREGIDDMKYLKLIERLIQEKGIDSVIINNAKDFLEEIFNSVELDKNGFAKNWKTTIDPSVFRKRAANIIEQLSYKYTF